MGTMQGMNLLKSVNDIGFQDFTNDLVSQTCKTVVNTCLEQNQSYIDMVQSVSQSLADYQKEVAGIDYSSDSTNADNLIALQDYTTNVLSLAYVDDNKAEIKWKGAETPEQDALADHFKGVDQVESKDLDIDVLAYKDEDLKAVDIYKFIYDKLKKDTERTYDLLIQVLQTGLISAEFKEANIRTRLIFKVNATDLKTKISNSVNSKATAWNVNGSASARWGWGRANISGGVSSSKISVSTVRESDISSTNLNAEILGEVSIKMGAKIFPTLALEN